MAESVRTHFGLEAASVGDPFSGPQQLCSCQYRGRCLELFIAFLSCFSLSYVEESSMVVICGRKFCISSDPSEKAMAPHSSTLAWKIPWTEPGRLQSMGSLRVGHD